MFTVCSKHIHTSGYGYSKITRNVGAPGRICPVCHECWSCKPRTQKLKGLVQSPFTETAKSLYPDHVIHVECAEQLIAMAKENGKALPLGFARPCPVTPRHGFVESRVVSDEAQLLTLIEETRAADPKGEIMIMPFVNAEWNAVLVPGLMTLGKGHAGATSGQGEGLIRLPLANVWDKNQFMNCGLAADEVPYIEVVCQKRLYPLVTQVRSGPAIGSTNPCYVPKHTTITKIIPVTDDLLKWADIMAEHAGQDGVVVYHPHASVTDHASVHARTHAIPIVNYEVTLGMALDPLPTAPPPDPASVLAGVGWGDALHIDPSTTNTDHLVRLMLYGLHHNSACSGPDGKWIGFAAAMMLRLGSIALRGEARHEKSPSGKPARQVVWEKFYNASLSYHRAGISRLVNTFRYGIFSHGISCSSGGFGGMKWAACGASLIPLFNAVRDLAVAPTSDKVNSLIRALNRAVHQAHNGGWWMNKFCHDISAFSMIQKGDMTGLILALPTIWALHPPIPAKPASRYAAWPVSDVKPVKFTSLGMCILPGGIGITGKARGLRNSLILPISSAAFHSNINPLIDRQFRINNTEDGRIELLARRGNRIKAGNKTAKDLGLLKPQVPVSLWTEPPLQNYDQDVMAAFNTEEEQL